ncbi:5-formyltetrahydrofolate cyclo-ligase [Halorhodospira halochloris]
MRNSSVQENHDLKRELRRNLRAQRRNIGLARRRKAEYTILKRTLTLLKRRRARSVACYLDSDGEVPTQKLITQITLQGMDVYLPVLQHKSKRLCFRRYTYATPMRPNRYGILEPIPDQSPAIGANRLDAVLLPVVGFDRQGSRLGMGGGFYDTTLKFLQHRDWHPLITIGLAFELQLVDYIPTDRWDISLDRVVTERSVYQGRVKQVY